jgi:hypothetical protein
MNKVRSNSIPCKSHVVDGKLKILRANLLCEWETESAHLLHLTGRQEFVTRQSVLQLVDSKPQYTGDEVDHGLGLDERRYCRV